MDASKAVSTILVLKSLYDSSPGSIALKQALNVVVSKVMVEWDGTKEEKEKFTRLPDIARFILDLSLQNDGMPSKPPRL